MIEPRLSVVLPAYNEVDSVRVAIEKALDVLPDLVASSFEVIVVDDGSTDGTAEAVLPLLEAHPGHVRLLRHVRNRATAPPCAAAFSHARGELLFYTDADNQFDIRELKWFLPLIGEYDVVVGFRVYRYDPVLRSLLSVIYQPPGQCDVPGARVRDVDCAFKLFRREVIEKTPIRRHRLLVDTELLARARHWNFRIVEKGVRHYPRAAGATTVRASHISSTLRTVARMWREIYFPTRAMRAESAAQQERLDELALEVRLPTVTP